MPKSSPIQTSFNAGEFSPLLRGHIDLPKRGYALEECINMIPLVQGAIRRRGGSMFVSEVKDSNKSVRLATFKFSNSQSYTIEVGDRYMRFYRDRGQILNPDDSIYEISTPYLEADLNEIKMDTQSTDTMIITHPDYPVSTLTRYADDDWRLEEILFENGPFLPANQNSDGDQLILNYTFAQGLTSWTDLSTGSALISIGGGALLYLISPTGTAIAEQPVSIDNPSLRHRLVIRVLNRAVNVRIGTTSGADDILTTISLAPGTHTIDIDAPGVSPVYLQMFSTTGTNFTDCPQIDYVTLNSIGTKLKLTSSIGYAKGTIMDLQTDGSILFEEGHVGSLWKLKIGANEAICRTLEYIDGTKLLVQVLDQVPVALQNVFTDDWYEGLYNSINGYPSCSTFFQDRLVFGGIRGYPQRLDFSRTGDYYNFLGLDADGTITDSHAIAITINSNTVDTIFWVKDNEKGLIVGSDSSEFLVRSNSLGDVLTPSNIQTSRIGTYGSVNISPKESNNSILFLQRGGRKIRELSYTFTTDGFVSPDMTILAEHITESRIKDMSFQTIPNNILWCVRNDGVLIGFTYERVEQVVAWHRHIFGGVEAKVESVTVTPFENIEDVWVIVKRKINGEYKKYIEYMTPEFTGENELSDAILQDSTLSYEGTPIQTFDGLEHLEGETVKIMADGYAHKELVVSAGSITIEQPASKIHVGLGNTWKIKTLPIEAGSADGIAQGKTKRIHKFVLRVFKSLDVKYKRGDDGDSFTSGKLGFAYSYPKELFTGDIVNPFPSGYDTDGQIILTGDNIFPVCILAIMPQILTEDAR